jgi:hypothetical protein
MKLHDSLVHFVLSFFLLSISAVGTASENPLRDKYATWLEKSYMGRTMVSQTNSSNETAGTSSETKQTSTYHDLSRTQSGLKFKQSIVVKQTIYDVVNGARVEPGRDLSRSIVKECEVRTLAFDAKRMAGYCHTISISNYDSIGLADSLIMSLEGDVMTMIRKSTTARECYAAGGSYYPCMVESEGTLSLEDGKLVTRSKSLTFPVDASTWEKNGEPDVQDSENRE